MYLMNLMNKKCMTRVDLSMMSGVPDSTLRDILSGKAQIDHCEAATIYGIADALGTTVENVLDHYWDECLRADDEECEREVLHDGHTMLLFYSTVDRVVQLRQHVDDALLTSCVNSEALIDLFFVVIEEVAAHALVHKFLLTVLKDKGKVLLIGQFTRKRQVH